MTSATSQTSSLRSTLRSTARKLRASLGARVVILLYHRIGSNERDPHRLAVSPENFDQQMSILRSLGPVLSLAELGNALDSKKLPRRATVVTFDDGYVDNLQLARPILERHDIPSTIFMTTGPIGRVREFWWDELQRIFLEPGPLPSTIRLNVDGQSHEWTLNDEASRRRAHNAVYALLWDLQHEFRLRLLDELLAQTGRRLEVRSTKRAMSDQEILELSKCRLIEIGAHTHTHPNLAAQSREVQCDEIARSKSRLTELLGRSPESFAYPFGLHTSETVQIVRETGFKRACACMDHAVRQQSEMHRLTRADLGDLDGDAFARKWREAVNW